MTPSAADVAPTRTDTHPFAPYVRVLGRGPGKSRSLSREEARHALGMVLADEAAPEQVGAFLMLLRYRGEAVDEMIGLVEAARAHAGVPFRLALPVDLDWPSYADGRTRGLPWYLLAALLLAKSGRRVLMHGPLSGPGRIGLRESLTSLGIVPAASMAEAEAELARINFAFLALEGFSPGLTRLLALRGVLGLRSPINTVGRLLNPANAAAGVDGVFHPAYVDLHLHAAAGLGRSALVVLKGGGGEAEWTGAKALAARELRAGVYSDTAWNPLPGAGKSALDDAAGLLAFWRGEREDPAAHAAMIGTAALAIHAMDGTEPAAALDAARQLWAERGT